MVKKAVHADLGCAVVEAALAAHLSDIDAAAPKAPVEAAEATFTQARLTCIFGNGETR